MKSLFWFGKDIEKLIYSFWTVWVWVVSLSYLATFVFNVECRRNIDEVYAVNLLWFGNNLYWRICQDMPNIKPTKNYTSLPSAQCKGCRVR